MNVLYRAGIALFISGFVLRLFLVGAQPQYKDLLFVISFSLAVVGLAIAISGNFGK